MSIKNLKHYIERLWEIIHECRTLYSIYLDEYFVSLKEYSFHVNKIFLSMWKIFGLHDKNILNFFFVVHKSFAHVLVPHCSRSHVHTVVVLHVFPM
jgi:hypothetical protein